MPYVDKVVGYTTVQKSYTDEDGLIRTYDAEEPIMEPQWETPWQPEHMPVGSRVLIKLDISSTPEIVARVTGHARQAGAEWVIHTDYTNPTYPSFDDGPRSYHNCHVKRVLERGTGGVKWDTYLPGYEGVKEPLQSLHQKKRSKRPTTYHADSVRDLVQQLMYGHPQFRYVSQDNHLYEFYPEGSPSIAEQLLAIPGLIQFHFFAEDVYEPEHLTARDRMKLSTVSANKRNVVKALHAILRRCRANRKVAGKLYELEMAKYFEYLDQIDA